MSFPSESLMRSPSMVRYQIPSEPFSAPTTGMFAFDSRGIDLLTSSSVSWPFEPIEYFTNVIVYPVSFTPLYVGTIFFIYS